ncbi:hypothetical protein SAMN05443582_104377 [Phyllobacterium sp. OV277]|nr:hypothetical protein SAMN05443582_104377 [Phyllobacterium sp. OV277]
MGDCAPKNLPQLTLYLIILYKLSKHTRLRNGRLAPSSSPFPGKVSRPESGHLFEIRCQHTFDPFHECADSARQITSMRYDEGHGERQAPKIGYDLHKRSIL